MHLYIVRTSGPAKHHESFVDADTVIRSLLDSGQHKVIDEILHYKYMIEDIIKDAGHRQLSFNAALIPSPAKPIPLYASKTRGAKGFYFLYFCRFPAPWLFDDYDAKEWDVEEFVSSFVDEVVETKKEGE